MTHISGDHTFRADETFQGSITGNATVVSGVSVTMQGHVFGDFYVESGGALRLSGTVGGTIYNRGGDVSVTGMYGDLINEGETSARIDKIAMKTGRA